MSFANRLRRVGPVCAGCGSPAQWEVWEQPLCSECHALWIRDDRFSAGAVNAALGISNDPKDFTEANHARYCAEATRRTKAWLVERRTARAA